MPGVGVAVAVGFNKGFAGSTPGGDVTYHLNLPADFPTELNIGSSLTDESIVIAYSATRGSDRQYGEIVVLCPAVDEVRNPPYHTRDFDDVGLSCTAGLSGTDIILTLTTDDSSLDDVDFDYIIDRISRGGGQSWEQQWQTIVTPEYQAIYDAMTVKPVGLDLAVQNWLVYQLVTNGYWDKFDILRYYATQSNDNKEGLLNWKSPADSPSLMKGTYGTFAGTETWTVYGNNTCVNIGNEIKGTYVDNASGIYRVLTSSYIETTYQGRPYTIRARCKVDSGAGYLKEVYSQVTSSTPITSTEYAWYEISFIRGAAGIAPGINMSAGTVIYVDEYYVIESHKAVIVNNPTFTASKGFTGIAASNAYINQLYHLATSSSKFSLNSSSHILYIINESNVNESAHGTYALATSKTYLIPKSATKILSFANNSAERCGTIYNWDRAGLYVNTRTASNKVQLYKNRELIIDSTTDSTALATASVATLAVSTQSEVKITPERYTNDQVFVEAYGEGLTQSESEGVSDIINSAATYLGINKYKNAYKFDRPILVLTFDNCENGWESVGVPYFVSKGIYPTLYIVGSVPGGAYPDLTWANLLNRNNLGFDIQCHSFTHPFLDTLTYEEIITELQNVNTAFITNGLPVPIHHAYPSGVFNSTVISAVSSMRLTGRAFYDATGTVYRNTFKYSNKYELPSFRIDRLTYTDVQIRGMITDMMDKAIAVNGAFCGIGHNINNTGGGETQTSDLDYWIAYAEANGMDIMNMSEFYELLD